MAGSRGRGDQDLSFPSVEWNCPQRLPSPLTAAGEVRHTWPGPLQPAGARHGTRPVWLSPNTLRLSSPRPVREALCPQGSPRGCRQPGVLRASVSEAASTPTESRARTQPPPGLGGGWTPRSLLPQKVRRALSDCGIRQAGLEHQALSLSLSVAPRDLEVVKQVYVARLWLPQMGL